MYSNGIGKTILFIKLPIIYLSKTRNNGNYIDFFLSESFLKNHRIFIWVTSYNDYFSVLPPLIFCIWNPNDLWLLWIEYIISSVIFLKPSVKPSKRIFTRSCTRDDDVFSSSPVISFRLLAPNRSDLLLILMSKKHINNHLNFCFIHSFNATLNGYIDQKVAYACQHWEACFNN